MGRSKVAKPPTARSSAAPTAHSKGLSTSELLTPILKPTLGLAGLYILFSFILPALADLTPPGVDPKELHAMVKEQTALVKAGCTTTCEGLGCPSGWTTARAPNDPCKCICARIDPNKKDTPWDKEQQQQKQQLPEQGAKPADRAAVGGESPAGHAEASADTPVADGTPDLQGGGWQGGGPLADAAQPAMGEAVEWK